MNPNMSDRDKAIGSGVPVEFLDELRVLGYLFRSFVQFRNVGSYTQTMVFAGGTMPQAPHSGEDILFNVVVGNIKLDDYKVELEIVRSEEIPVRLFCAEWFIKGAVDLNEFYPRLLAAFKIVKDSIGHKIQN